MKNRLPGKRQLLYGILSSAILMASCSKNKENAVVPGSSNDFKKVRTGGSPADNEAHFDLVVETASYGLLDLRANPAFVNIVRGAVSNHFDNDDDVLFKNLATACTEQGINLASQMTATLNRIGRTDLVPYVNDAINGFSYFDQTAYMQIYIPFFGTAPATETPILVINKNGLETAPALNNTSDMPSLITIDRATAATHHDWVVGVNERVDNAGQVPSRLEVLGTNRTTGTPDGSFWINRIQYDDWKETWVNGGPEIGSAYHYGPINSGPVDYYRMTGYFYTNTTGLTNQWMIPGQVCEKVISKTSPNSSCSLLPVFPASPNKVMSIVIFERDFRKMYDRQARSNPNNPSTEVTFGSMETPYGSIVIGQNQILTGPPLVNQIWGMDVEFGYGLTNSGMYTVYRNH